MERDRAGEKNENNYNSYQKLFLGILPKALVEIIASEAVYKS